MAAGLLASLGGCNGLHCGAVMLPVLRSICAFRKAVWLGPALSALLALVVSAVAPARAHACATCTCGDPTLTTMGLQQPFAGRVRLSVELRYRQDAVGQVGLDRTELSERRASVAVAVAPWDWAMFSLVLPVMHRSVTDVSGADDTVFGLGDVELKARAIVFRDRSFAPQHLLGVLAGLRLPTAPLLQNSAGNYLDPELQAGTGSFDPSLGLSYAFFADPWSIYVSEQVVLPTGGRGDWRMGASLLGSHAVQYQFDPMWGVRLGANIRLDDRAKRYSPNRVEPDTGGFVAYAAPALIVSPLTDLVLNLEVNVPVINALVGHHDEGFAVSLGVAFDA